MHTHKHTHTQTHTQTAQRDTVACVWPMQKRIRSGTNSAPLETIVARGFHCVLRISTRNTASKPKKRGFTPSPSLALLLPIVLGSVVKIESRKPQIEHAANDTVRFLSLAPLLSFVRGNGATTLMLASNEQSGTFKATTNSDLCRFLRSFCSFLPLASHKKNGRQYKCFGRNTLLVLYNINVSTVILPPRQHYIYIYIYIIYILD